MWRILSAIEESDSRLEPPQVFHTTFVSTHTGGVMDLFIWELCEKMVNGQ